MTTSEVTANPSAARVQLIPAPIASPGHCVICGKSEHEKGFVDPRLDFEFYGSLYFCCDCVGEIASLFNFISPEKAVMLATRLQQLEEETAIQRESLLLLEQTVDNLANYNSIRSVAVNASNATSESSTSNAGAEEISVSAGGSVIPLTGRNSTTESDINEPVDEQRPDDVSESTGGDSDTSIIDL